MFWKRKNRNVENEYVRLVGSLLSIQLGLKFKVPKEAFGTLMTNRAAQGYVFGFHDALLQRAGLYDPQNPSRSVALIEQSYKALFGDQAGYALIHRSLHSQEDEEFTRGRTIGGEELVAYSESKAPPFGLTLMLSFDKTNHQSLNAIDMFEREIEKWPKEQAQIGLSLLKAILQGDDDQIDRLYPLLTVSQLEAVNTTLEAMEAESGIDAD